MVGLFRGTAAVACEGDQVQRCCLEHCWKLYQVLEEGLGGTIASVNFPENYEDNTDCSFTIVPVPGNHVTLQVNLVFIHLESLHHVRLCVCHSICRTSWFYSFDALENSQK